MFWLVVLILILQGGFHWLLNPEIVFASQIFELRNFGLLAVLMIVWIFSGKSGFRNLND